MEFSIALITIKSTTNGTDLPTFTEQISRQKTQSTTDFCKGIRLGFFYGGMYVINIQHESLRILFLEGVLALKRAVWFVPKNDHMIIHFTQFVEENSSPTLWIFSRNRTRHCPRV